MHRVPHSFEIALAATLLISTFALAGEKKLKQADVPKPVINTVTSKYPGVKLKGFGQEEEAGKTVYEVEFKQGGDKVSVDVSAEGKILAEETVIAPADLPAPVKAGLEASTYKGWKVSKAEKVITDEKTEAPRYEVLVQGGGKKVEVVLDKDGKIVKEEPKKPKDND